MEGFQVGGMLWHCFAGTKALLLGQMGAEHLSSETAHPAERMAEPSQNEAARLTVYGHFGSPGAARQGLLAVAMLAALLAPVPTGAPPCLRSGTLANNLIISRPGGAFYELRKD